MTFGYPFLFNDDWNPSARRKRFIDGVQPLSVELLNTPSTPKKNKSNSSGGSAGVVHRGTPVFLQDDADDPHPIPARPHQTCDLIYRPNPNRKNKKQRPTTPFKHPTKLLPEEEQELLELERERNCGPSDSITLRPNKTICFDDRVPTFVPSEPQIRLGRSAQRKGSIQNSSVRSRNSHVTGILSSRTQLSSVASVSSYNSNVSTVQHLQHPHPPPIYGMDYVCESGSEFLIQSSTPGPTPGSTSTSRPGPTGLELGNWSRAMEIAHAQQLQDLIRTSSDSVSSSRIPRSSSMQSLPTGNHYAAGGGIIGGTSAPTTIGGGRRPSQPLSESARSSSQQMNFAWPGGGGGGSEASFSILHHTTTLDDGIAGGSHQRLVPPPPPLLRASPSDRSISLGQNGLVSNNNNNNNNNIGSSSGIGAGNNNLNSGGGSHQAIRPVNPIVIGKTSIAHVTKPSTVVAASKITNVLKPNDEGAKWLMYLSNSNEKDLQDYI